MLSPSKRKKWRWARAAAGLVQGRGAHSPRVPTTAEIKLGWQAQRSPSGTPQFSLPELCTTNAAHTGNEAPEGNELALPGSFQQSPAVVGDRIRSGFCASKRAVPF